VRETPGSARAVQTPEKKRVFAEILSALLNLGYKRKEAEHAVEEVFRRSQNPGSEDLETLLRNALRLLMKE